MVNIDECPLALAPELEHAPANPDPSSISPDAWEPFEAAALGVMGRIQPTVLSEARRAAVVDYIQRLVRCSVGCEVLVTPFRHAPILYFICFPYCSVGRRTLQFHCFVHQGHVQGVQVCGVYLLERDNPEIMPV
jgi:hypothetical protein